MRLSRSALFTKNRLIVPKDAWSDNVSVKRSAQAYRKKDNMKKIITLVFACIALPMMAQSEMDTTTIATPSAQEQLLVYENPKLTVYVGDITYQPMTKGQKTAGILTGLLNNEVSIEDEAMVEGAKEG